jgi:hypothetical protein
MTADDPRPVPPPPHPELDTLAELQAGALDGASAERLRPHVSSCAQCAGVLAALETVRRELHELHERPSPPMPATVAARLDATLADLRRGEVPAAGRPAPVRSGSGTADPTRLPDRTAPRSGPPAEVGARAGAGSAADLNAARERRRRRLVRGFGAVAAAVAVIAAGASVTALVRTGGTDNSTSSAAGSAGTAADSAGQAAAPAEGTRSAAPSIAIPTYDRNTLRTALPSIAQESAVSVITGRDDTGRAGAMADTGRRTACAGTIRGSRGQLQAVERIRYEGMPAYVFVFDDNGKRTGFVVSDECGTSTAFPASVLDTVS